MRMRIMMMKEERVYVEEGIALMLLITRAKCTFIYLPQSHR